MPDQTAAKEIVYIETNDGQQVDITYELSEMRSISRSFYTQECLPDGAERKFLHRTGWGLIHLIGIDGAIELVAELEFGGEINSYLASYLYRSWSELAALIADAEAAD